MSPEWRPQPHVVQTVHTPSSMVSSFFRNRCFAFCGIDKTASDKLVVVCVGSCDVGSEHLWTRVWEHGVCRQLANGRQEPEWKALF